MLPESIYFDQDCLSRLISEAYLINDFMQCSGHVCMVLTKTANAKVLEYLIHHFSPINAYFTHDRTHGHACKFVLKRSEIFTYLVAASSKVSSMTQLRVQVSSYRTLRQHSAIKRRVTWLICQLGAQNLGFCDEKTKICLFLYPGSSKTPCPAPLMA